MKCTRIDVYVGPIIGKISRYYKVIAFDGQQVKEHLDEDDGEESIVQSHVRWVMDLLLA